MKFVKIFEEYVRKVELRFDDHVEKQSDYSAYPERLKCDLKKNDDMKEWLHLSGHNSLRYPNWQVAYEVEYPGKESSIHPQFIDDTIKKYNANLKYELIRYSTFKVFLLFRLEENTVKDFVKYNLLNDLNDFAKYIIEMLIEEFPQEFHDIRGNLASKEFGI